MIEEKELKLLDKLRAAEQELQKEESKVLMRLGKEQEAQERLKARAEIARNRHSVSTGDCLAPGTGKDKADIKRLIQDLEDGKCKGIKSGIAYKIAHYATEAGYLS